MWSSWTVLGAGRGEDVNIGDVKELLGRLVAVGVCKAGRGKGAGLGEVGRGKGAGMGEEVESWGGSLQPVLLRSRQYQKPLNDQ